MNLTWRGTYAATSTYQVGDLAFLNGSSYISLAIQTGVAPTNIASWSVFAQAGSIGPQGPVGVSGNRGQQGLQGATGIQGIEGPQGIQGPAGAPGATGQGLTWRNTYDAAITYNAYDCVSFHNSAYICITDDVSGQEPDTSPTAWNVLCLGVSSVPWSEITGAPAFATVATSGSYNDLNNQPVLGTAAAMNSTAFDAAGAANAVQTNLTSEIARAEAAEALLLPITTAASAYATQTALSAEATARANADALLLPVATAASTYALQSGLTAETSRATTAEGLLAPKANPSFTGVVLGADGSASAPTYSFSNSTQSGLFRNSTGVAFAFNGTEIFGARSGGGSGFYAGRTGSFYKAWLPVSTSYDTSPFNLSVGLGWVSGSDASATADTGLSRGSAATLNFGNGTAADVSGTVAANQANLNELVVTALATPVNAAFSTSTTGGTLAAGTYYYRVAATDAQGTTLASSETSQVTTGTTSTVTVNWTRVAGATGYKVYGRTAGAEQLIGTVSGSVLSFVDSGSITPSGALPAANTTGVVKFSTDTGLSRGSTGNVYVGNGTAGDSSGSITAANASITSITSGSVAQSGNVSRLDYRGLDAASNALFGFSSTTSSSGTLDTALSRGAANAIYFGNGSVVGDQSGTIVANQASLNELVIAGLAIPVNSTFTTATTGGTLVPGTYCYRVAAMDGIGTTLASTETSIVVPSGTSTNTVTVNWSKIAGATGYKVYGRTTGAELLIGTVTGGSVLSFVDSGSVTPSGALPSSNSTGSLSMNGTLTTGGLTAYANGAVYVGTSLLGGNGSQSFTVGINTAANTINLDAGSAYSSSAAKNAINLKTFSYTNTSGASAGVSVLPVYNQASGTASNTDFLINRTQTAVGSGTQLLLDAQVGGVSQLSIGNTGKITKYNGTTTAGMGTPVIVAATTLTGQTAALSQTVFFTATTAGLYRVSGAIRVTVAGVGTGITLTLNGGLGGGSNVTLAGNSIAPSVNVGFGGTVSGMVYMNAGEAAAYSVAFNSITTAPTYLIAVTVEQLA